MLFIYSHGNLIETVTRRYSIKNYNKKLFIKISINSWETPLPESFFNKDAGWMSATLLKIEKILTQVFSYILCIFL